MLSDPTNGGTKVVVRFHATLYSSEIIERAAYRFIDRFALELVPEMEFWVCTLTATRKNDSRDLAGLVDDFQKEVLDQKLRASIRAQTDTVRNLVLARAFSRSGLVEDDTGGKA